MKTVWSRMLHIGNGHSVPINHHYGLLHVYHAGLGAIILTHLWQRLYISYNIFQKKFWAKTDSV
jgi:hypothetical protein